MLCSAILVRPVLASNTGGVPTPTLKPFEKTFAYRLGITPAEDDTAPRTLHRWHYQQSFTPLTRWRLIAQARDFGDSLEYDEVRVQYLWLNAKLPGAAYDSGYRVDLRTRKGERPEQASLVWTQRLQWDQSISLTGVLLGHWQFGTGANPGTRLETRFSLAYRFTSAQRLAFESFHDFGEIGSSTSFSAQRHSAGVMYSHLVGQTQFSIGYQRGLSSAAADNTLRIWFSHTL